MNCPHKRVKVGPHTVLHLKCGLDNPYHAGHCRAVLADDVVVSWPKD